MQFVGEVFVCLMVAFLINVIAFLNLRGAKRARVFAESRSRELRTHLADPLSRGLDSVLARARESLKEFFSGSEPPLYVFSEIEECHRVLASTVPKTAVVRHLALAHDEGVVGFTADRKAVTVTQISRTDHTGQVFNKLREPIGVHRTLSPANLEKCDTALNWIYASPIFDSSPTAQWSDRVLGVLTLDGLEAATNEVAYGARFQAAMDAIAAEAAPYVAALHVTQNKAVPEGV